MFSKIYKNKHEMIMIEKRFGSYVSLRIKTFYKGKYIAPYQRCFSPMFFLRKFKPFPKESTLFFREGALLFSEQSCLQGEGV
jgi:hypothetical protein